MTQAAIEPLIARALEKRRPLLNSASTNAVRLIDGEGDQLPGVLLDRLDDVWLVSTQDRNLPDFFRRPCPEARALYWKRLDRDEKAAPQRIWGEPRETPFHIQENGIRFEISMQAGYSQGIFLDQRDNRARVRACARPGERILNTFSYTAAFSVAAALAGAITTSLDLSSPYLNWGKRNFLANDLDPETQHFCKGDALSWMTRFAKQGRHFGGVILDPPTFSRGPTGVFRVRRDYERLVQAAAAIIEPKGWLLATCNDRGLTHQRFEVLVRQGIQAATRRLGRLTHTPMPPDFTGEPYLKSVWVDLE